MSDDKFDCIIVGTGPAGSAAAYELARRGLEVALVEKGDRPGCKNMTGGRLYCHSLRQIIPDFWEEAPVERRVEKEELCFLTERGAVTLTLDNEALGEESARSYTVLRADFDAWLAGKAEEAGAMIVTGIRVDDLLWSGDRVCGIKAGEDEIFSDVVIAADGVNSLLARKAGLRGELRPEHVAVGVKSVIALPKKIVEDRFCLRENTGAARLFVGACTKGVPGGGFLYTNKESLSLGLVFNVASLVKAGVSVAEAVEDFKFHPVIQPFVEGGEVVEYSAHLVPEAGLAMKPVLFTGGMLVAGDAAGFVLNTGYIVRGMDFAVTSGALAARAVMAAKEKGDFSAATLKIYGDFLRQSHVFRDLETYKNVPDLLEEPDLYTTFPTLAVDILTDLFKVKGDPPERVRKLVMRHLNRKKSFLKLVKTCWKGARSL
ncbi:MAG TPA: FAD-dependent oxidoreductase [Bacillota bacterium]|nr:FAD-dependent oxidoreductase [Bacillota bacterium]